MAAALLLSVPLAAAAADDSAGAILDYEGIVEEYGLLFAGYEAALEEFETLEADFIAAKAAYEALAGAYLDDPESVHYEDVEEAYDLAKALLEALEALKLEIDGMIEELESKATQAEALFAGMMEDYGDAIAGYKAELKAYAQDVASYLKAEAGLLAGHLAKVREYRQWLMMHPDYDGEMDEYHRAYEQWEADKADYEALQNKFDFGAESSLLYIGGKGVPAYLPGNNSANGGKKVNPNDGPVALAPGLTLVAERGSDLWDFIVTEEAVGIEYIFWAHGNTDGEYIKVIFPAAGAYPIGNNRGMNHVRLVDSAGVPGDGPVHPGDRIYDPGCYAPGDFPGLNLDVPGKLQKVVLPTGDPVLVTLGLDGKIVKIVPDPDPDPDPDPEPDEGDGDGDGDDDGDSDGPGPGTGTGSRPVYDPDPYDDYTPAYPPGPVYESTVPAAPPVTVTIPDTPAPLARTPDEPDEDLTIEDDDVPLGQLPRTGHTGTGAAFMLGLGLPGAAVAYTVRRKYGRHDPMKREKVKH
ncbi:MAG: hypothetical protein FWG28_03760 [Clostridiales bacterium]|nr:hypothetical protein [Clostridiales bacterium]